MEYNISIQDIKDDMRLENETDVYYIDSLNDIAYHMHEQSNGDCVYMKNTGRQISPISEQEFIKAVNEKCQGSIGSDSYYSFRKP